MVNNFKETVKIYEQGKKYSDTLKSVNNLVKDAKKVQQPILMVGDITDIYVSSFQKMLRDEMMSLYEDMTRVATSIARLSALFYVAVRVWQSLARSEPIDVYPLLRPFAIGFCILLFPTIVLGTMNGVLTLVVQDTHGMLEAQLLNTKMVL